MATLDAIEAKMRDPRYKRLRCVSIQSLSLSTIRLTIYLVKSLVLITQNFRLVACVCNHVRSSQ